MTETTNTPTDREAVDELAKEIAALRALLAERDAIEAATLERAASVGGMWFGFNSEGEPDGTYCTVEPHDPGGMSLWVRADRIRALSTNREALDAAIADAVKKERERCAGIARAATHHHALCDFYCHDDCPTHTDVATAIMDDTQ